MRSTFRQVVAVGALFVALACAASAPGAGYYLDKIWNTPDYTQTDTAYGGFPDEYGVLHGGVFCGPTSVSNSLMWLDDHGCPNLAPSTSDRKKDQHDLIEVIASESYFDAYEYNGLSPTRLANGLDDYLHDCGYQYSRFQWQGRRSVPSWVDTGVNIPDFNWMREGIEGPGTIQFWSVGWYGYNAATDNYTRNGGHWVTMVGYGHNGTTYNPDYFIIHDPSPRCGMGFRNEYVLPVRLSSGTIGSENITGQYKLTGWPISSVGDCAILDGVYVVDVIPGNYAPVAVDDPATEYAADYSGDEDVAITIEAYNGVLYNDSDLDQDPLTAVPLINPAHGSLELNGDGSFTYTPAPDYHGPDTFKYRAFDGTAYSAVATVNLDIVSINDAPIAVDDAYDVQQGSTLIAYKWEGVLANDSDADNQDADPDNDVTLEIVAQSDPAYGSLQWYSGGAFKYIPIPSFHGTDSFTYKLFDGEDWSSLATVLIDVLSAMQIPGDATGDGVVDADDAAVLAANWGQQVGGGASAGDFNGDGWVNVADASILAANWGNHAGEAGATPVPEPATFVLGLGILAALPLVRRRNS